MAHAGIIPGADDANFDRCLSHIVLPILRAMGTSIQRTTIAPGKSL
jgi:hypothetical protein